VVAASEYRALQQQVRELQRLLGEKTVENEILREALDLAQPKKGCRAHPHPVAEIHHEDGRRHARVARSNLAAVAVEASCSRRGRRPQPETDLLAETPARRPMATDGSM
jgi:hypothetical protein